jgi:ATP-dependent Zn protease
MSSKGKIAITCAVVICVAGVLWMAITGQRSLTTYTYSQFLEQVHSGQVASVIVIGSNSGAVEATCRLKDGKTVRTVLPSDYRDALVAMQNKLVSIEIRDSFSGPFPLLIKATPFLLVLGIWIYLMIRKVPKGPRQSAWG